MPQYHSQTDAIPLGKAIDHYFHLSLYLLVLTGFGTLASTGGLDLPTIVVVGVSLAARGYLLAKRRSLVISERWTTPLTVVYFESAYDPIPKTVELLAAPLVSASR